MIHRLRGRLDESMRLRGSLDVASKKDHSAGLQEL